MSAYDVTIRVVSYYAVSVRAGDEEDALGLDPADLLDQTDCDHAALDSAEITGAECTEEDDGECPSCGGSGGGEDRALHCGSCGGSGQRRIGRDEDPDPPCREPREYRGSRDPE